MNQRPSTPLPAIRQTGPATGVVDLGDSREPIQVIGTPTIIEAIKPSCVQQAIATRLAPGVSQVVLNPDAHYGHGVPVGSVLVSPTHVYPGPVGVDIKCSMSLLQTNVPEDVIAQPALRRKLIQEIEARLAGTSRPARNRGVNEEVGFDAAVQGASKQVLKKLGIPVAWADRCEDAYHLPPHGGTDALALRLGKHLREGVILKFHEKCRQLGSYGSGNHFGECEIVRVRDTDLARSASKEFGLVDGHVAFLSHCGSRGLGHALAVHQFKTLQQSFRKRGIGLPSGDPQLVFAEYGSPEADRYLRDMCLGANFATVNHLLLNSIVLEAFEKVLPGTQGQLVYMISHNIVRRECLDGQWQWVHRKGATRAFPAGHPELEGTPYQDFGHPILLPGNPCDGSSVMVACQQALQTAFSINHGAGRRMTRTKAKSQLRQADVQEQFQKANVLSIRRTYPIDEAPEAYKDFSEVLRSVEMAGLATEIARLEARFVLKDSRPA